jgi:hypothetical protein
VTSSSQGATQASTCKVDCRLAEPIGRELLSSIGRLQATLARACVLIQSNATHYFFPPNSKALYVGIATD